MMERITPTRPDRSTNSVADALNRLIPETVSLDRALAAAEETLAAVETRCATLEARLAQIEERLADHQQDEKRHTGPRLDAREKDERL